MNVTKDTVVTVQYTIADAQGEILEESSEPFDYLHGGYDNIFAKIESALEGHGTGFETYVYLEPEDAFGEYDPDLVRLESRQKFPEPIEIGMQFEGLPEDGGNESDGIVYTVTDLTPDQVVVDGNHPFAGMALQFKIKVLSVRAATVEELAQGYVQDEGDLEWVVGKTVEKPTIH